MGTQSENGRRRISYIALTTDNIKYNGAGTGLTITLNSLANSATVGRQSTVVDNTSNLYIDVEVTVVISSSTSALASPFSVNCYLSGAGDGTNFDQDDGVMGASDAAYTINSPTNLRLGAVMNCPTASKVYNKTFSVAQAFGGIMPNKWVLVVVNNTGQALLSSGNSASYTGITYTNQ